MTVKSNRYNGEFKDDIIRLIREKKWPVNKAAKDLGANNQTIRNWLKAAEIKQT